MFLTAAHAIAEQVGDESLATGLVYPPRERIFNASLHVAEQVANSIFDQGLARVPRPDDVGAHIRSRVYRPVYSD
jgi:malate dehydrogenase (oxaloacetate-decarboxylating)(NADP+)